MLSTGLDVQREYLAFAYIAAIERLRRIERVIRSASSSAPESTIGVFRKQERLVQERWNELADFKLERKIPSATGQNVKSLYSIVQSFHSQIPELHQSVVRWTSGPWAPIDITSAMLLTVKTAMGESAYEMLRKHSPVVAQVGLYDFLGDFGGVHDQPDEPFDDPTATITWAMPAAEIPNPLSWLMLLHEIAHTVIAKTGAVREIIHDVRGTQTPDELARLNTFLSEVVADRIATDIAGPAYYAAISSFAVLEHSRGLRERRTEERLRRAGERPKAYPSAIERVRLVQYHLENVLNLKLNTRNDEALTALDRVGRIFGGRLEVDQKSHRADLQSDVPHGWLPKTEVWTDMANAAYDRVFGLFFTQERYGQSTHALASRLAMDLGRGRPVGASQDAGAAAQTFRALETKTLASFTDEQRRTLLDGLREYPNPPIAILNAAWIAEFSTWYDKRYEAVMTALAGGTHFHQMIDEFQHLLDQRDGLVTQSINASLLHRELEPE